MKFRTHAGWGRGKFADRIRKVSFALTQFNWEGSESDLSGQGGEARPSSDEIQGISDSTGVDGEVVEAIVTTDGAAGASWNRPPSISSDRLEMLEVSEQRHRMMILTPGGLLLTHFWQI
ncbi:MAG: hypothetical protein CM1200mP40_09640 [Gammaproteobacteria bacterium]|nr:MAG: hypothetical protein CM1200mP40_09640 [Gammaproteobacteria bacterium]